MHKSLSCLKISDETGTLPGMSHNPSYYRYRIREKHRRIFVLTKTQFVVGFLVSLFFSIFFSAYFERYGHFLVAHTKELLLQAFQAADENPSERELASQTDDPILESLTIEERLKRLQARTGPLETLPLQKGNSNSRAVAP